MRGCRRDKRARERERERETERDRERKKEVKHDRPERKKMLHVEMWSCVEALMERCSIMFVCSAPLSSSGRTRKKSPHADYSLVETTKKVWQSNNSTCLQLK